MQKCSALLEFLCNHAGFKIVQGGVELDAIMLFKFFSFESINWIIEIHHVTV